MKFSASSPSWTRMLQCSQATPAWGGLLVKCVYSRNLEAISGDIISEVDMDREMRLSQRIVDELLSIYM